jgi:uncharacterized phage protein gp47/JayE
MAFAIPDIKAVVQRARNGFRAEMPGTDAWIWPNNVYVTAKVIGGAVWEVFGRLKWMDRQRFALTAEGYELERHGLDYGIARKPASYAQGNLVVVADTWPLNIPVGTVFSRGDGVTYTSTQAREVGKYSLSALVPVVCDTSGRTGNTVYGAPFASAGGLAGIESIAVDEYGLGQGADIETDDQLRTRILHRKRYPPHGGAEYDYVAWGLELPGVTRVFPAGNAYGRGTVGVWFLMDETYLAGIPQPVDVAAVQQHIDAVAPVTANVIVQAPTADCIDIVVKGLSPDTQEVRESVAAELQSLFRRMAQPGLPQNPFTLYRSQLWQAVSNATGELHHEIAAPLTDLTFGVGIMPCLASVTFLPAD